MTQDEAMQMLERVFADFSAEERECFRDNVERRLGLRIGEKVSPDLHDKVARVLVEEIQMVLMGRDA